MGEIIKNIVIAFLTAILLAMTIRSILSWILPADNKLSYTLYYITEPFIYPCRYIFFKLNVFQKSPIDIAYLVTFILIFLITRVLP